MINSELSHVMIIKESIGPTNGYIKKVQTDSSTEIELVFAIQQKNLEEIEKILNDVSDPKSSNYGKHLTKQEVDELTVNREGHALVLEYLNNINALIVSSNPNYITTTASASIWNNALSTTFYEYENINPNQLQLKTVNRCEQYSLPENIIKQVSSVLNTVQFPVPMNIGKGPRIVKVPLTKGPQVTHFNDINNEN
jgi:tripeptidyl-peptidase-1